MTDNAPEDHRPLDAVRDVQNISRTLSAFARLADAKAYEHFDEVFAAEVTFDYGSGHQQRSLRALTTLVSSHLDRCGPTQHLIGSIAIDVDGDRATSRAYVQARHQRRNDTNGSVFDTNGEYADRWEKRPQGWRIVDRRASWAMTTGDPSILAVTG